MKYLYLNGTKILFDNDMNLLTFLETQNLSQKQIAVAINGSVIQKKEYKKTIIREGDKIEVVHAVGGGK